MRLTARVCRKYGLQCFDEDCRMAQEAYIQFRQGVGLMLEVGVQNRSAA